MIQLLSALPPTGTDFLDYIFIGGRSGEDEQYLHSLHFHFTLLEMH